MTKQEQIEAKHNKPIEIDDYVKIKVPYTKTETVTEGRGKKKTTKKVIHDLVFETNGRIEAIHMDIETSGLDFSYDKAKLIGVVYRISIGSVSIPMEINKFLPSKYTGHEKGIFAEAKFVYPTFGECGANPFAKEKRRINFYNQEIVSLLFKAGYGKRNDNGFDAPEYKNPNPDGTTYGGVNFNPYIIDANGVRQYYQRELVWTLEQKQLLIDSIYNGIEIGKFLFRYIGWSRLEVERKETGHGHSFDCVDGKQRFFAILHFIQNKYPDSYGNYWRDLNPNSQVRLLQYPNLSYGEMGEDATDNDVVDNFLTLNFTGTPMSKDHIEYVKSFTL